VVIAGLAELTSKAAQELGVMLEALQSELDQQNSIAVPISA
jgi:hypothetical protein